MFPLKSYSLRAISAKPSLSIFKIRFNTIIVSTMLFAAQEVAEQSHKSAAIDIVAVSDIFALWDQSGATRLLYRLSFK